MNKILMMLGLILMILVLLAVLFAMANSAAATRQVATAATVSAAGQTAGTIAVTILATLLAITLGVIGYLSLRLRAAGNSAAGRWMPGPNARWGRIESAPQPEMPQSDPLNTLLQLELMRYMRELHNPVQIAPALRMEDSNENWTGW